MPLLPETRAFLAAAGAETPRIDRSSGILAMRLANDARELRFDVRAPAMLREEMTTFTVKDGTALALEIYEPYPPSARPRGILFFIHGGGWVMCSPKTHSNMCRYLCAKAGVLGVNIEYRLAPEHKFPTALEDCVSAFEWVVANIAHYGGDADRIVVAGDSAGGNLAAVLAQQSARGRLAGIAAQALFYPSVGMGVRERFPSWQALGGGEYGVSQADAEWMTELYLQSPEQRYDVRFNPILAESLQGSPPALIITAEFDPLLDEGNAYAARLTAAGARVEAHCFAGVIHAFMSMAEALPTGYRALDVAARFIAQHAGHLDSLRQVEESNADTE